MTGSLPQPFKIRLSRNITLTSIFAMVALLVISRDGSVATVLLLCSPLAIVIPGIALQWYRTYSWLSLMILLYFIVAVTRAMAPEGNWADYLFVALTVTIFWTSAFCSRWLQRYYFELNRSELNRSELNNFESNSQQSEPQ